MKPRSEASEFLFKLKVVFLLSAAILIMLLIFFNFYSEADVVLFYKTRHVRIITIVFTSVITGFGAGFMVARSIPRKQKKQRIEISANNL